MMLTSTVSASSSVVSSPLNVPRRPRTRALTQFPERPPRSITGISPAQLAVAAVAADRTLRRSRRPSHIRLPPCHSITLTTNSRRINTRTINQRRLPTHTSTRTTATFTPNRNLTHMHMQTGIRA
jgi:hypothetical protein